MAYRDSDATYYVPLGFWFMNVSRYEPNGPVCRWMYVPRHGTRLLLTADEAQAAGYFKVCGCSGRFYEWGAEEDGGLSLLRPDTEAERSRSLNEYGNTGLRADARAIDDYLGDLADCVDFENEDLDSLCYRQKGALPTDKKSRAVLLSRMYLSLRYELRNGGEYLPSIMTFFLDYLVPTLLEERSMDETQVRRPEAVMYLLLNDLDNRGHMDHGCFIGCGWVGERQKIDVLPEFRAEVLPWARSWARS